MSKLCIPMVLVVMTAGACSLHGQYPDDVGTAYVQLSRVPAGVGCVRILVQSGARVVDRRFDVNVGDTTAFNLDQLPLGSDIFIGQAYANACNAIGGTPPSWLSPPTSAFLIAGERTAVSLLLEPTGSANVCVGFDDGTDGGCQMGGNPPDLAVAPDLAPPPKVNITVTARFFAPGAGVVTLAGQSCNSDGCTLTTQVDPGSSVSVLATPSSASTLFHFSGDCLGQSCTLNATADRKVTVTFTGHNYVFITSTSFAANFGGLMGGDAICQQRATAAGLPGHYVAWLSTSTLSAASRLGLARGWIRPDGLPFTDAVGSLTMAKQVYYPPSVNELGTITNTQAFTATRPDGTLDSQGSCSDFTSQSQTQHIIFGGGLGGSGSWTYNAGGDCTIAAGLYCFGIDLNAPLAKPTATGRIAFVSKNLLQPPAGVPDADMMCASEASAAGLTGTFLAAMSTNTTAWASRFNAMGPPWVRTDGVALVRSAADLISANPLLLASLNVGADGTIFWGGTPKEYAWTGSSNPTKTATNPATDDCSNWTSGSATGYVGVPTYAYGSGAFSQGNYVYVGSCSEPKHFYCLQQ